MRKLMRPETPPEYCPSHTEGHTTDAAPPVELASSLSSVPYAGQTTPSFPLKNGTVSHMPQILLTAALTTLLALPALAQNRPPATPLITHDPYFSIWSNTDHLTDSPTRHWTGTPQPLASLISIDGKPFRIMGDSPRNVPALPQTALALTPTHTRYTFAGSGITLDLEFFTPAFLDDLDLLSRPVTYLTWTAHSTDATPPRSLHPPRRQPHHRHQHPQSIRHVQPPPHGLHRGPLRRHPRPIHPQPFRRRPPHRLGLLPHRHPENSFRSFDDLVAPNRILRQRWIHRRRR